VKKPSISVVMPSYNHGRYVDACIEAFLGQTFQDFELIIIDDASTDDNVDRIRQYADKRINLVARGKNCGVAAGMCEGFQLAKADLVAFFASDDLPEPGYLSSAVGVMGCAPDAVAAYFPLRKIDEQGQITGDICSLPRGVGRFELLKRSFKEGNQLPSPGMVIRRDAALSTLVPTGVSQYSDWILNNRLLLRGDVAFAPDGLVLYRVSSASLSARSDKAISREAAETRLMMDDFLSITSMAHVCEIFGEDAAEFAHLSDVHVPYVLGRLALGSGYHEKRCWGYETIMRHVSQPGCASSLEKSAGFTYKELMALAPALVGSPVKEINDLRRRLRRQKRISAGLALLAFLVGGYLLLSR
jgi:glycosyltransferase involved in cell wall biosynthesis